MCVGYYIFCFGVGVGDFGDDVVCLGVVVVEVDVVDDFQCGGGVDFGQVCEVVIIFCCDLYVGQCGGVVDFEQIVFVVDQFVVVVCYCCGCDCVFGFQEGVEFFCEIELFQLVICGFGIVVWLLECIEFGKVFVGQLFEWCFVGFVVGVGQGEYDDFVGQFVVLFVEVLFVFYWCDDYGCGECVVGGGCLGDGDCDELDWVGGDYLYVGLFD